MNDIKLNISINKDENRVEAVLKSGQDVRMQYVAPIVHHTNERGDLLAYIITSMMGLWDRVEEGL